jgi:hypothetical protein
MFGVGVNREAPSHPSAGLTGFADSAYVTCLFNGLQVFLSEPGLALLLGAFLFCMSR